MNQLSRRQVLVGAAFGLAAAGCSGKSATTAAKNLSANEVGAMAKYAAGDQFKATAALTFPLLYLDNASYPLKSNWLFWSELTKRTGVTLQTTAVPGSDYNDKRSLMIGAGTAPLLIPKTYPGSETAFVGSGTVMAVSDYTDQIGRAHV